MWEVIACISLLLSGISVYILLNSYRKLHVFLEKPAEAFDFNDVTASFNEWVGDDTNRDSLIKNAENLLAAPIAKKLYESIRGAMGGTSKGINASMKSLSNDLLSDAVDTTFPGMGGLASKYLSKYPEIKALLPMLLSRAGNAGGIGQTGITDITGGFNLPFGRPPNNSSNKPW